MSRRSSSTGSCINVLALIAMLSIAAGALAKEYRWTGEASEAWGEAANWQPKAVPDSRTDRVIFTGEARQTVALGDATRAIESLTFDTDATLAIESGTLRLTANGSIRKAAAERDHNSVIRAALHLLGDATFMNDNEWVHQARKLQLHGPIGGRGTIRIRGEGLGGVEITADNRESFTGAIHLHSGNLIVGHDGALGDTRTGTVLHGGEIWFNGVTVAENFTILQSATQSSLGPSAITGNIHVNPRSTFTIKNGGGNALELSGVVSGAGDIVMTAGGTRFTGSQSNTLTGTITVAANSENPALATVKLGKRDGAIAIAGDLVLKNRAVLLWERNDQVIDSATVTLEGGTLRPGGLSETMGPLVLTGSATIELIGDSALRFADSRSRKWTGKQLLITHWSEKSSLSFGRSGLSPRQLAMIGFVDPQGFDAGLYRAQISDAGEVTPSPTPVVAIDPPFDVAPAARKARTAIYTVNSLPILTGEDSPLPDNTRISFFGDSITWQNGYLDMLQKAITFGPGTRDRNITLINRGINGGGVLQVRDGSDKAAYNGRDNDGPQDGFADVIAQDKADIAVVFIGINDVWWRETTPQVFEQALRDIAAAAKANNTRLVLATMTVRYEKPDGSNPDDAKIDAYCEITRKVARDTGAVLVDLRKAYIAYLQNHNTQLQLDGSLTFERTGLLTYDGVHPTETGNTLLANHLANGLIEAARNH